jgi:predicted tellurium resistance membrane protein TerC
MLASLLHRFRWIAWSGLAVVLYVALRMIWAGAAEVMRAVGPEAGWAQFLAA